MEGLAKKENTPENANEFQQHETESLSAKSHLDKLELDSSMQKLHEGQELCVIMYICNKYSCSYMDQLQCCITRLCNVLPPSDIKTTYTTTP